MNIKLNTPSAGQSTALPAILLGVPDVARALGIGQTYTWQLLKERKLPCVRIGRRTLVPAAALSEFAASLSSAKQ